MALNWKQEKNVTQFAEHISDWDGCILEAGDECMEEPAVSLMDLQEGLQMLELLGDDLSINLSYSNDDLSRLPYFRQVHQDQRQRVWDHLSSMYCDVASSVNPSLSAS